MGTGGGESFHASQFQSTIKTTTQCIFDHTQHSRIRVGFDSILIKIYKMESYHTHTHIYIHTCIFISISLLRLRIWKGIRVREIDRETLGEKNVDKERIDFIPKLRSVIILY